MYTSIVMYCCNKTHIYIGIVFSDTRESLLTIGAGDIQTIHINDTTINANYNPASKEHTIQWDTALQRDIYLVVYVNILYILEFLP